MKRTILALLTVLALTDGRCPAAGPTEQPAAPKADNAEPAEMSKPVTPEREITFEVSKEEKPLLIGMGFDPGLFEQHFVAEFQLTERGVLQGVPESMGASPWTAFRPEFLPGLSPRQGESMVSVRDAAGVDSNRYNAVVKLYGGTLGMNSFRWFTLRRDAPIEPALEELSSQRSPSEDVLTLLRRKGSPYYRVDPVQKDAEGRLTLRYSILAPTPEQAQELVRGLLSFFDYGIFYPLQEADLAAKRVHEQLLPRYRTRLAEVREESAALEKTYADLEEFDDLTDEVVAGLTVERRRIDVDVASVKARIDACNEMLKTVGRQERARYDQIEILRTAAEIDMVGLAAKRDALNELIAAAAARKTTQRKLDERAMEINTLERAITASEEEISRYETELKNLVPYPVEGGKVTIYPIKWVAPEN